MGPEGLRTSEEVERAWLTRFGTRDAPEVFHRCPDTVAAITRRAWSSLVQKTTRDQVVPGLPGLGAGLVIMILALSLPGWPPIVVYTTDPAVTRAYHSLQVPVIGRCASRYPMYYDGPEGVPTPLDRRGLPRRNPQRPRVYRAFTEADLVHWTSVLDEAKVLILGDNPNDIPEQRPAPAHTILRGIVARSANQFDLIHSP